MVSGHGIVLNPPIPMRVYGTGLDPRTALSVDVIQLSRAAATAVALAAAPVRRPAVVAAAL